MHIVLLFLLVNNHKIVGENKQYRSKIRTKFILDITDNIPLYFMYLVCQQDCSEADTDYTGFDVEEGIYTSEISALACQEKCQDNIYCAYWTWDTTYKNACWKKTDKGPVNPASGLTSGPKFCDAEFDLGKIRVMSYNMFGWNALHNEYKTKNLFKTIRYENISSHPLTSFITAGWHRYRQIKQQRPA